MFRNAAVDWFPLLPGWTIVPAAAALAGLVLWGCASMARKQVPRRWIAVLATLRLVAAALLVAALLQPTLSFFQTVERRPELLVLVDTSKSMQARDDGGGTRLESAVAPLRSGALRHAIEQGYDVRWFGFDRSAYPVAGDRLEAIQPRGDATDVAAGLASAVNLADFVALADSLADSSGGASMNAGAPASRRVLLASDGLDQGAEDAAETAAKLGLAVDVLPVGTEEAGRITGPSVRLVLSAPRVLLGSETQFLVELETAADAPRDHVVTVYEDSVEVLKQNVVLRAKATEYRARLAYRPTEPGLKHYEFAVAAGKQSANEAQPAPTTPAAPAATRAAGTKSDTPATDASQPIDRYGVNVQVVDDKIEVLVLEDRWRWEFKFFRRVLEDDPSFNFTAMLARGSGAFVQMGEPDRQVTLGSFPQSREELDWFDVIVLGDVRPSRWPAGLAAALADAVIEGGKSLVVVAGPAIQELAEIPELHELLPVELTSRSSTPVEGPLAVSLTPEGAARGWFAADGGTSAVPTTLDRIYPPLRKRPAATVLVEAAREANAAGRLIALAEQPVGRGRVLYVGTDALWKWRMLVPADQNAATPYDRFWQQALRGLTPRRPTSAPPLWVETDRSRYASGEHVRLRAETPLDSDGKPLELEASVVLPDQRRLPLRFDDAGDSTGMLRAEFDAGPAGRYRIAAAAMRDGRPAAETSLAVDVSPRQAELETASPDRARLERLAARTGGKVVDPQNPQTWPVRSEMLESYDRRRTVDFWNNGSLLVVLCLVLGSDWLLRMLRGYT